MKNLKYVELFRFCILSDENKYGCLELNMKNMYYIFV